MQRTHCSHLIKKKIQQKIIIHLKSPAFMKKYPQINSVYITKIAHRFCSFCAFSISVFFFVVVFLWVVFLCHFHSMQLFFPLDYTIFLALSVLNIICKCHVVCVRAIFFPLFHSLGIYADYEFYRRNVTY